MFKIGKEYRGHDGTGFVYYCVYSGSSLAVFKRRHFKSKNASEVTLSQSMYPCYMEGEPDDSKDAVRILEIELDEYRKIRDKLQIETNTVIEKILKVEDEIRIMKGEDNARKTE